ncbi:MAG: branched-chain amino acid aminotransferase [Flavobacteriaceae bacterium]|jgi:branched-chain amino acid aminotransferase
MIKVTQIEKSKISTIDFDNLSFGTIFSDHMMVCDFKNGQWQQAEIKPYEPFTFDPSASVFHYGQALFEGMKAYKGENNEVFLFRPDQNIKRFNKSSERMAIPEFPEDLFLEGLNQLLRLDADWIPQGEGQSLYVRPFVIATEPCIQANPSKEYRFAIICSPVSSYFSGAVKVKIENHYSRATPGGFGYAKAAGNYGGQFYPTELAKAEGFHQIIWTDAVSHQYIEEAGTMNVFVRIGDTLITNPTSDTILDGVTRKSLIQLAKDLNIPLEVRPIAINELIEASAKGELLELFGAGTAAVISLIETFNYKGQNYHVENDANSYAQQLKKALTDIQLNRAEDLHEWRYQIK